MFARAPRGPTHTVFVYRSPSFSRTLSPLPSVLLLCLFWPRFHCTAPRLPSRAPPMEEGGVNNHDSKLSFHGKPGRRRLATFLDDFRSTRSIVNHEPDPSYFPMRLRSFNTATTSLVTRGQWRFNVTATCTGHDAPGLFVSSPGFLCTVVYVTFVLSGVTLFLNYVQPFSRRDRFKKFFVRFSIA